MNCECQNQNTRVEVKNIAEIKAELANDSVRRDGVQKVVSVQVLKEQNDEKAVETCSSGMCEFGPPEYINRDHISHKSNRNHEYLIVNVQEPSKLF